MRKLIALIGATIAMAGGAATAQTATAAVPRSQTVYVLGDSYTVLMNWQGFQTSFGPGWSVYAAGRGGRNVGYPTPSPNGLQQANKDRARIAAAGTVVIELGTNLGDRSKFGYYMKVLIARIRTYSPGVRIFWVEPGNFVPQAQAIHAQRIADEDQLGVGIIHWEELAHAHPEWFAADPKHPNVEGTKSLMGLIRGAVQHDAT